jgi:proline dehydrogenase
MSIEPGTVSFENTANAFEYKTDKELKKAEFLFSSMGYAALVKLGTRLTPWMIRSGLPVKGLIRDTIFSQFVGGETLEETASVARKLGEYHVEVILDYGVEGGEEGERGFEQACGEFIRVIDYAATRPNIPFMSIKVTGFARFGLLEKLHAAMDQFEGPLLKRYDQALEGLGAAEKEEWQAVGRRMQKICERAAEKKIGVLVDAEETWIQGPVDMLTILMMEKYNKGRVVVYNTIQLYRADRLDFLHDSYAAAAQRDFILGAKLVRGRKSGSGRKHWVSPRRSSRTKTRRIGITTPR